MSPDEQFGVISYTSGRRFVSPRSRTAYIVERATPHTSLIIISG